MVFSLFWILIGRPMGEDIAPLFVPPLATLLHASNALNAQSNFKIFLGMSSAFLERQLRESFFCLKFDFITIF